MLLIYTHQINNRIQYIFQLMLKDLMGMEFKITDDKAFFLNSIQPKISYTTEALGKECFFKSVDLLFETEIREQNITVFEWNEKKVFYKTDSTSALPFDVFAVSFYLVTRYEEYLNYTPDKYGRYTATNSLAYKNNFLQEPLVNQYVVELRKFLIEKFPQLIFQEQKFQFISTVDIDNAYAYTGKGLYRTVGAIARSLLKFDFGDLKLRIAALAGRKTDAFDTYSYYFELQKKYQFPSIFFFLLGDFSLYDKNLPHTSARFRSLIKSIASRNEFGIHPSYYSNIKQGQLEKEVKRLKNITGITVTKSRQHFLKMKMPQTYQKLIAAGITDDYTMGYADEVGFRPSICSSFYFFDLEKNETTNLKLHPFAAMDATLNKYMNLLPDDAITVSQKLIDKVKAVNGTFISLWHNETLSEAGIWQGWRKVFEATINYSNNKN